MDMYSEHVDTPTISPNPIEKHRIAAGLSLAGLATFTGIPRSSLRRKITHPGTLSLAEVKRLAVAFNTDAVDLFIAATNFDEAEAA